jgi:hypothetical protein
VAIDDEGNVRVGCKTIDLFHVGAWLAISDEARTVVAEALLGQIAVNRIVTD